ncbi:MAG: hypothetical protein ACRC9V_12020 [Aeromonas sp.]
MPDWTPAGTPDWTTAGTPDWTLTGGLEVLSGGLAVLSGGWAVHGTSGCWTGLGAGIEFHLLHWLFIYVQNLVKSFQCLISKVSITYEVAQNLKPLIICLFRSLESLWLGQKKSNLGLKFFS